MTEAKRYRASIMYEVQSRTPSGGWFRVHGSVDAKGIENEIHAYRANQPTKQWRVVKLESYETELDW